MTEAVTSELIYSVLQRMQGHLAGPRFDVPEMKGRISLSSLNRRMDRFDERHAPVERRLDLTDAH